MWLCYNYGLKKYYFVYKCVAEIVLHFILI